jgi:membrane protease YdiL (CAAX protease family)
MFKRLPLATILGLALALFGLFGLRHVVFALFGPANGPTLPGLAGEWLLCGAVLFIALRVERLAPAQIGLRPVSTLTLFYGLLAGLAIIALMATVFALIRHTGISTHQVAGVMTKLLALPLAWRIALVITAGVAEEFLYRGYALERLTTLTGNLPVAAMISLAIFALGHLAVWGWIEVANALVGGLALTCLYLWRRNLPLNIMAHMVVDGFPLILLPLLHR